MNPAELITELGDSYLWLNIPDIADAECRQKVENIFHAEPLIDSRTVEKLLTFEDWRERMVGHVLAVRKRPRQFAFAMFDWLAAPCCLAIVPTCARVSIGLGG